MAPRPTDNVIYTQKNTRLFFQIDGAYPNNPLAYYGRQAQYALVDKEDESYGAIAPIWVRDPDSIDGFELLGTTRAAPDLGNASLVMMRKRGTVPRDIGKRRCPFFLYLPTGSCRTLADALNGWDTLQILDVLGAESRDGGAPMANDSDDSLKDTYSLKLGDNYRIGKLFFGQSAANQIDRDVVDQVWGGGVQCGGCGPQDDGSTRLYSITRSSGAGSPGLPAEVQFISYDKNTRAETVYQYALTGLTAASDPTFIDIMGQYLIVGSNADNSIFYAVIDSVNGTLGAFTEVTTGFVASKGPNDIYVANAGQAFIVGDGGYIYSMTDPTAGVTVLDAGSTTVQNLNRIHGQGTTLVAVGAAATVVISNNQGKTWATASAAPGAAALTAVCVKTDIHFWVGGASRYYTLDGGRSWVQQAISGATSITDIIFPTPSVGFTVYNTASSGGLQSTPYAGERWADSVNPNSQIGSFGTAALLNRAAAPRTTVDVITSFLALGGRLAAAGTDGRLFIGAANVQ